MRAPRQLTIAALLIGLTCATSQWTGRASAPLQSPTSPLPKVRLIATGGTIANRAGGRLTADDLLETAPPLERYVRAEAEQFANVSSSALTVTQWRDLARRINTVLRHDPELAGVVVTIGTDTLEETAYFLNLTIGSDKPVVMVGSLRDPDALGYDGPANLVAAFRVAAEPASSGKGVLVVMNEEIHAARDVTKADAHRLDAFDSRRYGILGVADSDRIVYYRSPTKRHTVATEFDITKIQELPRVDVVPAYQGASADLIKAAVDAGARGIVIAAAGAGATSGDQFEGISYAVSKGVPVVISSRTGGGRVTARQGSGPSASPRRIGGEDLPPLKARVLLMLALSSTSDGPAIQRMFTEY